MIPKSYCLYVYLECLVVEVCIFQTLLRPRMSCFACGLVARRKNTVLLKMDSTISFVDETHLRPPHGAAEFLSKKKH